jgi:flavin-binding protein dodecin
MQESSSVASSNDVVTCFGTSCEASDSSQEEAIERAEATLGQKATCRPDYEVRF